MTRSTRRKAAFFFVSHHRTRPTSALRYLNDFALVVIIIFVFLGSDGITTTKAMTIHDIGGMNNNLSLLLRHASRLRSTLPDRYRNIAVSSNKSSPSAAITKDELFVSSSYIKTKSTRRRYPDGDNNSNNQRGFCNWIIPGRLMVGQYPGQTPEVDGPTSEEVEQHIRTLLTEPDIGVSLFCSLQSEIPPQTDYQSWNKSNGKIYLEDDYNGSFPNWFSHYAPIVHQFAEVRNNISRSNWSSSSNNRHVEFLHHPIEDLSIPEDSTSLQSLLLKLLTATSVDNYATIYVHCWGGRGRAGLTAACLLSLVYPELDGGQILDWIQTGYDSRLGATAMPRPLSRSPQTESQRQFVRDFVNLVRLHHNKDSGKVSTK